MATIACKLHHGLVLELPGKTPVEIRGGLHPQAQFGFGLTEIDKAFAEEWLKRHAKLPCVANGFVFLQPERKDAVAEAREKEDEKLGTEPLDPKKLPADLEELKKDESK